MPVIEITSLPTLTPWEPSATLRQIADHVSARSGLPLERLVVTWKDLKSDHLLTAGETSSTVTHTTHHPVVHISMLKGNPRKTEEVVMVSTAEAVADVLGIDRRNVAVLMHRITHGHLYVDGQFR